MAEAKDKFESIREWVIDHKLRTVACLWLSGIAGSIAYNWSQPNMKTSVKIIHARLQAQAPILAALYGAVSVEYYDHRTGAKQEHGAKFLNLDRHSQKDFGNNFIKHPWMDFKYSLSLSLSLSLTML